MRCRIDCAANYFRAAGRVDCGWVIPERTGYFQLLVGEIAGAGGWDADPVARNIEAGDGLFKGLESSDPAANTRIYGDHGAAPFPAIAPLGCELRSIFRH